MRILDATAFEETKRYRGAAWARYGGQVGLRSIANTQFVALFDSLEDARAVLGEAFQLVEVAGMAWPRSDDIAAEEKGKFSLEQIFDAKERE